MVREGRGSVSLLQRSLGIGYGRGARLIDFMAEDGIVGAYNGSQAREVLITLEQWQAMSGGGAGAAATGSAEAPAKRSNKICPELEEDEEESVVDIESDDVEETDEDEYEEAADVDEDETDDG